MRASPDGSDNGDSECRDGRETAPCQDGGDSAGTAAGAGRADGADSANGTTVSGGTVGAVVQAGTVHGDITVHSAAPAPQSPQAPPVPRQIPLAPRNFTDRESELDLLDTAARTARSGGVPQIVVLDGPGGVGKTALATSFLDALADAFPDGLLYTDLRGFDRGGPVDPADVLDGFLRALNTDPARIAPEPGARAAQFRSSTAGRSMALLLDNAASAAQVRLLLPGTGAHVVLVTTRLQLAGLTADGAAFVEVAPLDESAAADLVQRMLGADRSGEAAAVRRLVAQCGRLPLALCAAASGLARRPGKTVGRLADQLADERGRLAKLSREEELSVQAVLDTSYAALPDAAQRLYRRLGHAEGPDTTPAAMATLLETSADSAEAAAEDLLSAHLLEEHAPGRYRQHDLNRLHARRRLADEESAAQRSAARRRLADHYLDSAINADHKLNPGRWHLGPRFDEPRGGEDFADRRSALAWLETELPNLRAGVAACLADGNYEASWQLCEALWNLFLLRKHFGAWRETYETGLAAALTADNPAAQGFMLGGLGTLRLHRGEPEAARAHLYSALEKWARAGHALGEAAALETCGTTELALGAPAVAAGYFERALDIHQRLGRQRGIALMRRRLGETARDRGDHAAAEVHFHRALDHFTESADPYMRLRTLVGLSANRAATGAHGGPELAEALRIAGDLGAETEVAGIHVLLADAAAAEGRAGAELAHLNTALSIYSAQHGSRAAEIRRRIGTRPRPGNR